MTDPNKGVHSDTNALDNAAHNAEQSGFTGTAKALRGVAVQNEREVQGGDYGVPEGRDAEEDI